MTRLFELPVGKSHELLLALQNQGFTLEDAEDVIGNPNKAKWLVDALWPEPWVAGYTHLFRSLREQQDLLLSLYSELPSGARPRRYKLQEFDAKSDHVQSIEDLEVLFLAGENLQETWHLNYRLLELTQPSVFTSDFVKDLSSLQLAPSGVQYQPGIHRVRINLLGNTHTVNRFGQSVDSIRTSAMMTDQKLAGIEVLAAYALQHPRLVQHQNGKELPYCHLAGITIGEDGENVLSLNWQSGGYKRVAFSGRPAYAMYEAFAAPLIIQ